MTLGEHVFPTRLIKFNVIRWRRGGRERERKVEVRGREVGKRAFAEVKRNSMRKIWNSVNGLFIILRYRNSPFYANEI